MNVDPSLIKLLIQSDKLKSHFFSDVDGILVFDKVKFQQFVSNKAFLPDSFTAYKNKIGLTHKGEYLSDSGEVVLDWPYKDCVLEGGQTKDDAKRNEVFWNETLAPDQIDRLLSPKALSNFKVYNAGGERAPNTDDINKQPNLLIKGNNLLVLHSLQKKYAGKVKLIYIDPPYNTGSDSFGYNDSFNHSTWLTFMRNRLQVAKNMLTPDGAIFVQLDDNEQAYLKVLLDEILGKENFINTISIKTKVAGVSGSHHGKSLANTVEYIHLYAKNKESFVFEQSLQSKINLQEYIEDYEASGKSWKYTSVVTELDEGEYVTSIEDGGGDEIKIYKHNLFKTSSVQAIAGREFGGDRFKVYSKYIDKIFRTTNAQSSIRGRVMDATRDWPEQVVSIEYVPKSGRNKGSSTRLYYKDSERNLFMWLKDTVIEEGGEIFKTDNLANLWTDIQYNNLTREGDIQFPNGKKPEKILFNVISLTTQPGDIVMDFHLGSGTTAAVAMKMNRRFIGIEQMNYGENDPVRRLISVINGDDTGISKVSGWQGGGSFLFCELANANQTYVEKIKRADTTDALLSMFDEIQNVAFLSYRADLDAFKKTEQEFRELALDDQKAVLLEMLDKNMLYIPLSEIEDETYNIGADEREFNKQFYRESQ